MLAHMSTKEEFAFQRGLVGKLLGLVEELRSA